MTNQAERRKAAEEKQAGAQAALEKLEAGVATVAEQIEATKSELAGLAALEHMRQEDLLAQENGKRKLQRLRAALATAQGRVTGAREELDAATLAVDQARLEELGTQLAGDTESLTALIEGEVLPKIAERLKQHRELAREVEVLKRAISLASGSHRDAVSSVGVRTLWSAIDVANPWEGIGQVLEAVVRDRRSTPRPPTEEELRARNQAEANAALQYRQYGELLVGPR